MLNFRVTLDAAQSDAVSVRYATADGTATAGADYVSARGAVRFAPGQTSRTIAVAVLDDAHDDSGETLTLTLSVPFGAQIADGSAIGTITNADAVPKAWLARFGRTVASHVVDAIGERLTATPETGSHVTIAGRRVTLGEGMQATQVDDAPMTLTDEAERWAERTAAARSARSDDDERIDGAEEDAGLVTGRELLLGSAFMLSMGDDPETGDGRGDVRWTAWGRASESSFDGNADGLSLNGEVTTFTLGADARRKATGLRALRWRTAPVRARSATREPDRTRPKEAGAARARLRAR